MFAFFRGLTNSKIGLFFVGIFVVAIAVGFAMADMSSYQLGDGSGGGRTTLAKVGKQKIDATEFAQRIQRQLDLARRDRPDITMQQLVSAGGVEDILAQLVDSVALSEFARSQGMLVSRKLEDGQIASIPLFRAFNGSVDRAAIDQFLNQTRMTEAQFRAELSREAMTSLLMTPASGAARAPFGLVTPYASMLLEERAGSLGFVPVSAVKTAAPTDADIAAYYQRNAMRYTVPERRAVRYATIARDAAAGTAAPTEAEIAKYYQDEKARYTARETRRLSQVIVPDEATAKAIAAKASAGTPLAAAAEAAGFAAAVLDKQTREGFTPQSNASLAAAVFSSPAGTVVPPAKSAIGWHVVRVDAIEATPARSLDQVRGEIVEALKTQKADQALSDIVARIEDSVADGATFDEAVKANGLTARTTPPLLASGVDPAAPDAPVPPEVAAAAKAAFASEQGDDPTVEQAVSNELFVLVVLDRVIAAAPPPLAQIRARVTADLVADRAMEAARKIADAAIAKVKGGSTLAEAFAGAGAPLPAPTAIGSQRQDIMRPGQRPNPEMALLFSMVVKTAKALEAPDRKGWYVVYLDRVKPGNATGRPDLVAAARAQFSQVLGQEYALQFAAAARAAVGATHNTAVVERLKRELVGGTNR
ncbi:peptidylprolyl isomerase [Sphingomonas flavalba]|uniref:peptidylprolyl isomerase n=1 Tax=Sphingomonas flavalba TaxID=2559804 RepID=UPI00109DF64A|nr:peptidylprolyl isomerase [Sphingomonas flavalba]